MTVRVICDSSQNVPEAHLQQLGIIERQASVIFGDEVYLNKVAISEAEFYQRLANLPKHAALPTTTQPSPGQFIDALRQTKADGATSAILTAVPAKLSGAFNSAVQAAGQETEIPVAMWDTASASMGVGLQTSRAAELARAGIGVRGHHGRAASHPRQRRHGVHGGHAQVSGGRLCQGMMGTLLNGRPMLMIEDGVLKPIGRERGRKSAKATLVIELGPVLAALAGPGLMALGALQEPV